MVKINNLKNERGVTMVILVVAVLILTLITSAVTYKSIDAFALKRYNRMNDDIEQLRQKVYEYYSDNKTIPKLTQYENLSIPEEKLDQTDNDVYYVIDLDLLDNVKLNFGDDYTSLKSGTSLSDLSDDLYVINDKTYNIYYAKGVEYRKNTYYSPEKLASEVSRINYLPIPVLKEGMTPIKWNDESNTWEETNKYDEEWYDYYAETPIWANAQTEDGSLWVWIPRYEYKITSDKKIETKFIPITQTVADDGYTIQEAFTADYLNGGYEKELQGIWVAKYETSMEQKSSDTWTSVVPSSDSVGNVNTSDTIRAVSKPNVQSWRYINK